MRTIFYGNVGLRYSWANRGPRVFAAARNLLWESVYHFICLFAFLFIYLKINKEIRENLLKPTFVLYEIPGLMFK
jgi:hypothetical protein